MAWRVVTRPSARLRERAESGQRALVRIILHNANSPPYRRTGAPRRYSFLGARWCSCYKKTKNKTKGRISTREQEEKELYNGNENNPPTPSCLWQEAPASTQKTQRKTRKPGRPFAGARGGGPGDEQGTSHLAAVRETTMETTWLRAARVRRRRPRLAAGCASTLFLKHKKIITNRTQLQSHRRHPAAAPPPHRPPPPHRSRRREPPTAAGRRVAAVVVRARMCARNTHRHTDLSRRRRRRRRRHRRRRRRRFRCRRSYSHLER